MKSLTSSRNDGKVYTYEKREKSSQINPQQFTKYREEFDQATSREEEKLTIFREAQAPNDIS